MMSWQRQSHPWWIDSQSTPRRSTWLQSTLSELDEKTKAMLKVIEEDADSFAQRAEMFYKKRPELINMVEDFYRAHRTLAVQFDQLKSESKSRLLATLEKPKDDLKSDFKNHLIRPLEKSNNELKSDYKKYLLHKLMNPMEKSYDSYTENSYPDSCESEIDDPEDHNEVDSNMGKEEDEESSGESEVDDPEEDQVVTKGMVAEGEVMKLKEEIERLKEENRIQKEQLMQKDEEKREVIRQLSLSLDIMKENVNQLTKTSIAKESSKTKNSPREFNMFKGFLSSAKLFGWSSKCQTNIVAL